MRERAARDSAEARVRASWSWRPEWRPRKKDRPRCGAKTRKGTPCQAPGSGRGGRCRNHGGLSTGPRTPEGRARAAAAVRARWARWRAARNPPHVICLPYRPLREQAGGTP